MKSSTLTTVLNGSLAFVLLLSVIFCVQYIFAVHQIRSLNAQVGYIARINKLFIPALENDCLEYSKKNPAIDPLLQSAGMKPGAPSKPATR